MADSFPVVSSGARGVMGKRERDLLSSPFPHPAPPPPCFRRVRDVFWVFLVCLFVCLFFVLSFEGEEMCLIGILRPDTGDLLAGNKTARKKLKARNYTVLIH